MHPSAPPPVRPNIWHSSSLTINHHSYHQIVTTENVVVKEVEVLKYVDQHVDRIVPVVKVRQKEKVVEVRHDELREKPFQVP